jgi:hypothetical protein
VGDVHQGCREKYTDLFDDNARLRERLRISYPATPVDCLLSTLSELWDAPWPGAVSRSDVIEHVRSAVAECREAIRAEAHGG